MGEPAIAGDIDVAQGASPSLEMTKSSLARIQSQPR